jgi:hypothetical protein
LRAGPKWDLASFSLKFICERGPQILVGCPCGSSVDLRDHRPSNTIRHARPRSTDASHPRLRYTDAGHAGPRSTKPSHPRLRFGTPDHDRQTLVTHDYDTQTLDTPDHDRLNLASHPRLRFGTPDHDRLTLVTHSGQCHKRPPYHSHICSWRQHACDATGLRVTRRRRIRHIVPQSMRPHWDT